MLDSSWIKVAVLCTIGICVQAMPFSATHNASAARSESVSKIAFASHRDGNWEIYVMDADGRHQTRLTTRVEQDRFPLWSPDASKIAFGSQIGTQGWELWIMNADGTGFKQLCSRISAKGYREWSPDGARIVLAATIDGDLEIFSVRGDGAGLTRLTTSGGEDNDPSWSPDGKSIVFSSMRDGNREIYVMRADGSGVTRLTNDPAADGSPTWSPDGSTIAFASARDGGQSGHEIYRMRPDGSHVERLTVGAGSSRDMPRWSPDGSRIAFQAVRGDNYDIEVVRIADRKRIKVAASPAYDGSYDWSHDGTQLAFISSRHGADALYVTDAEGKSARRLTAGRSLNPAWSR